MGNKIIGGDFEGYNIENSFGKIGLYKVWGFDTYELNKNNVDRVELLTEESKKKFLGSAGLGLVGGVLLGPLGLLAGILAGGNKKEVCFACYLKDGKKFMAITDPKTYQKVASLAF